MSRAGAGSGAGGGGGGRGGGEGGSCPSLYVDNQIAKKAEILINKNIGSSVREGLEILLTNDLSIGQDLGSFVPPSGSKNVGELLQNGLRILANAPHSTLDIDLSAQTVDVRKAYKKMALKYHPDKNPHTTPIFQAIQGAHEKLTDKVKRKEEEEKAKRAAASSKPPMNTPAPAANNGSYAYQPKPSPQQPQPQQQQSQKQNQHSSHFSHPHPGSKPSQGSASHRSQSNPRPTPPPSHSNSKNYPSDDQYYEEKYRQGGYGYQGEYRFQEAQRKARERVELKRAGAAARGHREPEPSNTPFQDGRNREYEAAAARAAERRKKQHGGKGESHRTPMSTPSFSAQKTLRKTKKFKSTLTSSSSEPCPLSSLPAPTGLRAEIIDETTVELCWDQIPTRLSSVRGIKTQLSWRLWSGYNLDTPSYQGNNDAERGSQHTQWETATVYITGEKVRKKNLLPTKKYEFRIRYVLASDYSGKKGASTEGIKGIWCHPIKVQLTQESGVPRSSPRPTPAAPVKQQPTRAQERRGSFAEEVSEEDREDNTPAEEVHSDEEDIDTSSQPSFPAWHQLLPPPDTITRKSLAGEPVRYIVSLHKYNRTASEIVGYISNSREVLVKKISGNWLLAQAHWKNTNIRESSNRHTGVVWGYCELTVYSEILGRHHQLFEPLVNSQSSSQLHHQKKKQPKKFPTNPLNRPHAQAANDVDIDESEGYDSFYYQPNEKRGVDIWVQKYDEQTGHYYYYNSNTGQSEWEAPEWIEEKDPTSGARYVIIHLLFSYSNFFTLPSQILCPPQYLRC